MELIIFNHRGLALSRAVMAELSQLTLTDFTPDSFWCSVFGISESTEGHTQIHCEPNGS